MRKYSHMKLKIRKNAEYTDKHVAGVLVQYSKILHIMLRKILTQLTRCDTV